MAYQEQILGTQSASVGSRFLALLIDALLIGVLAGILNTTLGARQAVFSASLSGLLAFIYFIALEATRGATLGKLALGLRVVKLDGSPIGWPESLIRNLLRIIDGLFAYLVAAVLIWTSPLKQRLGDKLAHTVVIKRR